MVDKVFFPNPIVVNPERPSTKSGQPLQKNRDGKPTAFDQVLNQKLPSSELKFSQHAQERLRSRGITMNEADIGLLTSAVDTVAQKGGKESLIMLNDAAFVVSVKNRTVVTAMDRSQMRGNVFTNIDSAVVI